MRPPEICQNEKRVLDTRRKNLNGIDYIEIGEELGGPTLTVYFFDAVPEGLSPDNIIIEGGTRITGIKAIDVQLCKVENPEHEDCARVLVDREGDFSLYTLRINGLGGFDPLYSQYDFSFKVECPTDLDCKEQHTCPTEARNEPEINYLAKDYASFRQLILDRWSLIMPSWRETHVPDLGIALAEILAYTGDDLSYYQDAVATEAYLNTARQRISVRRHARLVGYNVHEGCNARAWICVETNSDIPEINAEEIFFITGGPGIPSDQVVIGRDALPTSDSGYEVFEPVSPNPIRLYQAHNAIPFYTWGNRECCLPRASTHATLKDDWEPQPPQKPVEDQAPAPTKKPASSRKKITSAAADAQSLAENKRLAASATEQSSYYKNPVPAESGEPLRKLRNVKTGDIFILMEVRGPHTGDPADADPQKRHAVRLTKVEHSIDDLYHQPVVNIWWDAADALPFPLCISSPGGAPDCSYFEACSVACGNVILVDHGRLITGEPIEGHVPVLESAQSCLGEGRPAERTQGAGDFNPVLMRGPLTFYQGVRAGSPASRMLSQNAAAAQPQIGLQMRTLTGLWDASIQHGPKQESASLLLQQNGTQLDGSYAGPLGANLTICGSIADDWSTVTFGIYPPGVASTPLAAPEATISGTLQNGVLAGEYDGAKGKSTFRAVGRRQTLDWTPRADLLASGPRDNHFVVEVDDDSFPHLRFGDGQLGRAPEAGAGFVATYRIGNGRSGNVGHDSIKHIVLRSPISGLDVAKVTNPLPASGGTDPETLANIKLVAPSAFRTGLQRAITAADYATLAEQNPKVQRASASLRWTGSRYAVQVTVDPLGTEKPDPVLLEEIKHYLYRFRRIGHDLEVVPPGYVPLDLEMTVCVQPHYLRAHVKADVLSAFSAAVLPDGRHGFFHPDNLSFGDSIYVSRLVATAQAVSGVEAVQVTKLERLYQGDNHELDNGVLPIGPLEIARLDRDPSFPENGTLKLNLRGGR